MKLPAVDRRTLLIGGGAGVGLVIGFLVWPRREGTPLLPGKKDRLVNAYLRIGSDDRVTLAVPQAEVGQGIWTALAQVAGDELGADFSTIAVEPAPFADTYINSLVKWEGGRKGRVTALGTSVRAFEDPVRNAAASARDMLVRAAASRWGVDARECEASAGRVIHEGKALRFGEVAEAAAALPPPDKPVRRTVGTGKVAGQAQPRLELGAKSDGSLRFAADIRLPGMLFASVRMAPDGGRLIGHSEKAARQQQGFRQLVVRDRWIAGVGDSWWAAERALERADVRRSGPSFGHDTIGIRLADAMEAGDRHLIASAGDYEAAVEGARPLAATYGIAALPHYTLEPPAAAARFTGDRLEVWAATRIPDLARMVAARAGGVAERETTIYTMPIGDGSGVGFDVEVIAMAVELAKEVGKPVSLALSPQEAGHFDPVRPPLLARMAALPDPAGGIAAWSGRFAGMAGFAAAMARAAGRPAPAYRPVGAAPPYGIPALRVEAIDAALPLRAGYWRGDEEAMLAFANECFVDEMARAAGVEPLSYRIAMLGGAPRLARALTTATAIGGWDGGGKGSNMGLACASLQGSHIALVATATIGAGQQVEVSKLTAAVDCGRLVSPDLVKQQVEGGLLAAMAAATLPAPEFVGGMIRATTFAGKPFERLSKVPEVHVELIGSGQEPGGVSGLGMAVLAPAVANALASSTGRRLRNLPFDPMAG